MHAHAHAHTDKFLQSDCDAELLVTIRLRMDCKINDIVIKGKLLLNDYFIIKLKFYNKLNKITTTIR